MRWKHSYLHLTTTASSEARAPIINVRILQSMVSGFPPILSLGRTSNSYVYVVFWASRGTSNTSRVASI